MTTKARNPLLGADGIAAAVVMLGASALLIWAVKMPTMSAMLPVAMLVFLIVLGAIMLVKNVIALRRGAAKQARLVQRPKRAFGAFFGIVAYTVLVPLIGFYTSTIVMVPAVAWVFGYRNSARLMLGTAIFAASVFLVFSVAMGQQFPAEFFLR